RRGHLRPRLLLRRAGRSGGAALHVPDRGPRRAVGGARARTAAAARRPGARRPAGLVRRRPHQRPARPPPRARGLAPGLGLALRRAPARRALRHPLPQLLLDLGRAAAGHRSALELLLPHAGGDHAPAARRGRHRQAPRRPRGRGPADLPRPRRRDLPRLAALLRGRAVPRLLPPYASTATIAEPRPRARSTRAKGIQAGSSARLYHAVPWRGALPATRFWNDSVHDAGSVTHSTSTPKPIFSASRRRFRGLKICVWRGACSPDQ